MYSMNSKKEKVVLIGTIRRDIPRSEAEMSVSELGQLAESVGAEVRDRYFQSIKSIDPAYYIGKGKTQQIANELENSGVDTLIFDDDLTSTQIKNLEKVTKKKIIDRTGLILEIFSQNARSREAKTQIELAQLQYLLPRLTRQWKHLERQVGGIGVRAGMGETQLEVDRRLIKTDIKRLKEELKSIEKQHAVRRRRRKNIFKVSLVGYTNVGKSTLFNALVPQVKNKNKVFVDDRLFATLDSTVRRMHIEDNQVILLSDTVGFIRKLPHTLIAAFRSTLGVVRDADLLLNVVDVSRHDYEEQIEAVANVLKEIDADSKPVVLIFNKIDLVDNDRTAHAVRQKYPDAVFVSASRGIGLRNIITLLSESVERLYVTKNFTMPVHESRDIARLFEYGKVLEQTYDGEFTNIKVRLSVEDAKKFQAGNALG